MADPNQTRSRWWSRFRLSVRGLMVLVLVLGGTFGWAVHRAHVQRDAAQVIGKAGGVYYRSQYANGKVIRNAPPPGPRWLSDLVGPDMLDTVVFVGLRGDKIDDRVMAGLAELRDVVHLNIQGKFSPALTPAGISQVRRLSHLERLVVQGPPDTSEFLPCLGDQAGLRSIRLQSAVVSDAALARLARLSSLEVLVLDGRNVTDAGFAHLATAKDLRWLELGDCRVNDLSALSGLTHLERLQFSARTPRSAGSPPVDLGPLRGLPKLSMLVIDSLAVDDAGLARIKGMSQISILSVAGKGITETGLADLASMPSLTLLTLHRTSIHDLSALAPVLPRFRQLWLVDSPLGDDGLRPIAGATGLTWLTLRGTRVADAGLDHLAGLKALSTLDLSGTHVTDAGLAKLAGLPKLARLIITGTSISPSAIAALRKALPGLSIHH